MEIHSKANIEYMLLFSVAHTRCYRKKRFLGVSNSGAKTLDDSS